MRSLGRFLHAVNRASVDRFADNDGFSFLDAFSMKSHTERITLTVAKRMDFVNITHRVEDAVAKSGIRG